MTGCCNDIHLSMDDTFIQWNEILGDPSTSTSLVAFVDGKLAGIEDLINSLIDEKMAGITVNTDTPCHFVTFIVLE